MHVLSFVVTVYAGVRTFVGHCATPSSDSASESMPVPMSSSSGTLPGPFTDNNILRQNLFAPLPRLFPRRRHRGIWKRSTDVLQVGSNDTVRVCQFTTCAVGTKTKCSVCEGQFATSWTDICRVCQTNPYAACRSVSEHPLKALHWALVRSHSEPAALALRIDGLFLDT